MLCCFSLTLLKRFSWFLIWTHLHFVSRCWFLLSPVELPTAAQLKHHNQIPLISWRQRALWSLRKTPDQFLKMLLQPWGWSLKNFCNFLSCSSAPAPHINSPNELRLSFQPPLTQRAFQTQNGFLKTELGSVLWFQKYLKNNIPRLFQTSNQTTFFPLFKSSLGSEMCHHESFVTFTLLCTARIRCVCVSLSCWSLLPPQKTSAGLWVGSLEAVAPIQGNWSLANEGQLERPDQVRDWLGCII